MKLCDDVMASHQSKVSLSPAEACLHLVSICAASLRRTRVPAASLLTGLCVLVELSTQLACSRASACGKALSCGLSKMYRSSKGRGVRHLLARQRSGMVSRSPLSCETCHWRGHKCTMYSCCLRRAVFEISAYGRTPGKQHILMACQARAVTTETSTRQFCASIMGMQEEHTTVSSLTKQNIVHKRGVSSCSSLSRKVVFQTKGRAELHECEMML